MIENIGPTIHNGESIYNTGAGAGGGGGISSIRCCKGYDGNYIEIPINCSNRSKFEVGFRICGNWGKNRLGIFAGLGTTYYPPISLGDSNADTNSYGLICTRYHNNNNPEISTKNVLYPNNYIFYHAEMYTTADDSFFKLTDLDGNVTQNSIGYLINQYDVSKIILFGYNSAAWGNIPGFEIYYFKVDDILDLVPDEQNGVPGFTDNVSGNFYAPNNSTAFEAVKAIAPL